MTTLPKILESKSKIRFQHCDPFNHLNNAEYLNYMINAREDQILENYGIDIFKMAKKEGVSWVVGTNQIAYIKPAFLMEDIIVASQLFYHTKNELHVEIRMWNHDKSELKAFMWSTFIHFNLLQQKRWDHKEELMLLFEKVQQPLDHTNFADRIAFFKKK